MTEKEVVREVPEEFIPITQQEIIENRNHLLGKVFSSGVSAEKFHMFSHWLKNNQQLKVKLIFKLYEEENCWAVTPCDFEDFDNICFYDKQEALEFCRAFGFSMDFSCLNS